MTKHLIIQINATRFHNAMARLDCAVKIAANNFDLLGAFAADFPELLDEEEIDTQLECFSDTVLE